LTTDGSGLGVGVLGSGRSGFAAATHRTPPQAASPAGRTAAWWSSGATTAFSCTVRQRSSAALPPPAPPSLLLLTHGETAAPASWRLRPPVHLPHSFPLPLPLWIAAQHEEKPQGLLDRGRRRIWGNPPWGGGAVQGGRWGGYL
jgi:hypothetical protein